jgi:hypothetical protein
MQEFDLILGLCAACGAVALALRSYLQDIPEDPRSAREREVLAAFERHPQRRNGIATMVLADNEDRATVVVSHPETPAKCETWTFRRVGSEWLCAGVRA